MLYCACVLPIAMYGSRLWLYEGVAMKGPLDSLQKMQRRACLWITGAFKTSPMGAAETLMGVPPIHLHVKKLVERTCRLQASHAFCRLVDALCKPPDGCMLGACIPSNLGHVSIMVRLMI
jgi:hypothetical protein